MDVSEAKRLKELEASTLATNEPGLLAKSDPQLPVRWCPLAQKKTQIVTVLTGPWRACRAGEVSRASPFASAIISILDGTPTAWMMSQPPL
jgi:hypothetical protein